MHLHNRAGTLASNIYKGAVCLYCEITRTHIALAVRNAPYLCIGKQVVPCNHPCEGKLDFLLEHKILTKPVILNMAAQIGQSK